MKQGECAYLPCFATTHPFLPMEKLVNTKEEKLIESKPVQESLDPEIKDVLRFKKSLQELKDLRSQLHYAADYCKSTFLESEEKKEIVDNTKDYICRALVTVVDHLGNVSANLDCEISTSCSFSDAELRINCLSQKFLLCEQYANSLALTTSRWNPVLPRHNSRYLITASPSNERTNQVIRNPENSSLQKSEVHECVTEKGVPLFLNTSTEKTPLAKQSISEATAVRDETGKTIVPVRDGLCVLSKGSNSTFHFQGSRKNGRTILNRKSASNSDILSLIRRVTRIS